MALGHFYQLGLSHWVCEHCCGCLHGMRGSLPLGRCRVEVLLFLEQLCLYLVGAPRQCCQIIVLVFPNTHDIDITDPTIRRV